MPNAIVIGADTVVTIEGEILGREDFRKTRDTRESSSDITKIKWQRTQVITGLTVINGTTKKVEQNINITKLRFRELSQSLIDRHVSTGEPLDKAGAYAIQGKSALLVESIEGCYYNVVGLPLNALNRLLEKFGLNLL